MRWRSGGSSDSTWCRNSVTSSSSRSGERAPLMMIELENRSSSWTSSRDSDAARVDDDRREAVLLVAAPSLRAARARCDRAASDRAPCSRTSSLRELSSASAVVPAGHRLDVVGLRAARPCSSRSAGSSSTISTRRIAARELRSRGCLIASAELLALDRLERVTGRAHRERRARVVVRRDRRGRECAGCAGRA